MISAILVDDEIACIENMQALLARYCTHVNVIGTCVSIADARQMIETQKPQLVFLDIELPFGNGFELLEHFPKPAFEVIFVTAFEKYAIQAIRLSACDYILKPLHIDELVKAVNKATTRIKEKEGHTNIRVLVENMNKTGTEKKIALPGLQSMVFVKLNDILYCQADGGYTWFYFTNRDKLLITKNLGEYEEMLGALGFLRVHHSFLINAAHITEVGRGATVAVTMSNGVNIAISKRKKEVLQAYLDSMLR